MQQIVPQNEVSECSKSWILFDDGERVMQVCPEEDISKSQNEPDIDRQQNRRRVLSSIQENDFAKMVKKRRKNVWTEQENQSLIRLHDEVGNKWSAISKRFQNKTENDVKNRFFSQLRMGLRHLNKAASKLMGNKFEQIKPSVLFKIISSCEEEPKRLTQSTSHVKQLSKQLKMELFDLLKNNQFKKSFQVGQLVQKIRLFIAYKNPHIKSKKQKLRQTFTTICYEQNMSLQSEPIVEQTNKDTIFCKIKQMKTMQDSQNEPQVKQPRLQQIQTSLSDKFIQKPSICLNNPFEQLSLRIPIEQDSWSIDPHMDQSSFMALCYQELIFPNNQSRLL